MHTTRSRRRALASLVGLLTLAAVLVTSPPARAAGPNAVRPDAGFNTFDVIRNDDLSTGLVDIGFPVNFYGVNATQLYVNNNGNVTFDGPLATFTPFDIGTTQRRIIAPLFADVDTRNLGSQPVRYGQSTIDGHAAFGVNWVDVGFYQLRNVPLNSFQLVLIDRSDIGVGDFDIEFNYDRILWESGEASGSNSNGLGGSSARAGYSNGAVAPDTVSYELPGSAINGGFLDANATTGLTGHSLNSTQLGRYVFSVRNGVVLPPTNTTPTAAAGDDTSADEGAATSLDGSGSSDDDGDALTYSWAIVDQTGFDVGATCSLTDELTATPTLACNDDGVATVRLTVDDGQASDTDDVVVTVGNVPPKLESIVATGTTGPACISGNGVGLGFGSSDPGGNDVVHGDVNWGDGSATAPWTTSFSGNHTYAAGAFSLDISATDDDSAPIGATLPVSHLFSTGTGFQPPINASGTRSVFRLGSTVPVKIVVSDCNGALVSTLIPDVDLTRIDTNPDGDVNEVVSSSAADSGDDMRWVGDKYLFNLSTKRSQFCPSPACSNGDLQPGTYRLTVSDSAANDAFAPISVLIDLRR